MRRRRFIETVAGVGVEAPITARIRLAAGSRMTEGRGAVLTHRDMHAANTFENPNAVVPAALPVAIGGDAAP